MEKMWYREQRGEIFKDMVFEIKKILGSEFSHVPMWPQADCLPSLFLSFFIYILGTKLFFFKVLL